MSNMKSLKMTNLAKTRIKQTEDERNRVFECIQSNHPLDAEPDPIRKERRIKTVIGINSEQATRIARYDNSVYNNLSNEKRFRAEKIQGNTVDFFGISFLNSARIAADTVGRVIFYDGQPQGSGFMVSDHLFLTNNHVISNEDEARNFLIEFDYELDINDKPRSPTRFTIDPNKFFISNPEYELDFTLVAIGERISGHRSLNDFGYCPLIGTSDKHILGEFVNIIQHPEGDFKKIVLRENRLVTRLEQFLHYITDTMPGSSGSPVFNDQLEAIALHHYGEPSIIKTPDGKKLQRDINEGIRISAILNFLRSEKNKLKGPQLTLLDDLLSPSFRQPSKLRKDVLQKNDIFTESERTNTLTPSLDSNGVAKWTIPLEISVRLGVKDNEKNIIQSHIDTKIKDDDQILSEAIRIDPNYANRSGYKSNFLSGYTISLPSLTTTNQKENAAKKLEINTNGDPYELKYQHFSIIMNKDRRMAYFTAVNIDGSTWIHIDRDTGEPLEREKREKWFIDPRIETTAQCEESLYDNQTPIQVFDRGHLVRRQDSTWGTPDRAKSANADTFHFTNCSPQEWSFNRQTRYWQGIENYILDNAKADRERIIVFTGPIFADDDPKYRYVKVPQKFWKIIARVENGILLSTALLADQSQRITHLPERLKEGFDDLSKVKEYQTSIIEIENLTELDFGFLREHDTYQSRQENITGLKREIEKFEDIQLNFLTKEKTSSVNCTYCNKIFNSRARLAIHYKKGHPAMV